MPVQLDEYGIPIKASASNEVDEYGIQIKKKSGGSINGSISATQSNPFLAATKPTGTISNAQVQQANAGVGAAKNQSTEQTIASGTELSRLEAADKESFTKEQINKAAINTANVYFKNNPVLLSGLNKLKSDNSISLKNAPEKEDIYSLKNIKNTTVFQRKVEEIKKAYENGDIALTKFQSGELSGEPVFTKPAKFLRGIGQGIEGGANQTKDAFVNYTSSDKEFADYLDKQVAGLPEIPTEAGVGLGNYIGTNVGGLIKPMAEFGIGTSLTAESGGWGGFAALAADIAPSTMTAKTKELYYENMAALKERYGDNPIPEEERMNAMRSAKEGAGLQAIPEIAMQMYMFGRGGNAFSEVAKGGLDAFKKSLVKAGVDIPKMGLLGGAEEAATLGIQHLQGGEVKDAGKKIGQAIEDWATMEAMFKVLHGVTNVPKYIKSTAKEAYINTPPEIRQELSAEALAKGWVTQEQLEKTNHDLAQYEKIRQTLPEDISSEKAAAVTGLLQRNENLEAQKKTVNKILHDDIDLEIENNTAKAKQILNSNNPLKYETDELTGERGADVGGRPEKEAEAQAEIPIIKTDEGSAAVNERKPTDEGSKTKEGLGEDIQAEEARIRKEWDDEVNNSIPVFKQKEEKMFGNIIQKEGWVYGTANGTSERFNTKQDAIDAYKKTEEYQNSSSEINAKYEKQLSDLKAKKENVGEDIQPHQEKKYIADGLKLNSGITLTKNEKQTNEYSNEKDNNRVYNIKNENGEDIGEMELVEAKDHYYIGDIVINTPKKGIGTELYSSLANRLDKPLYSGNDLSKAATALWDKLVRIGKAEKFKGKDEYENTPKERYRIIKPKETITPNKQEEVLQKPLSAEKENISSNSVVEGIKITKNQNEDLLSAVENRIDTIKDDPESATSFENEKSLNDLKDKISSNNHNYTKEELQWLNEEMDEVIERTRSAQDDPETKKQATNDLKQHLKTKNEIEAAIEKISKTEKTNSVVEKPLENEPIKSEATKPISEVKEPTKQQGVKETVQESAKPNSGSGAEGEPTVLDDLADIHVEYPPTQLSHQGTEKLRTEFGGEEAPKKEAGSFIKWEKEANEKIESGYDTDKLLDKIENDDYRPTDVEHIILTKKADALAQKLRDIGKNKEGGGIRNPEFNKTLNEIDRIKRLSDLYGSKEGKALVARRFKTVNDDSLVGFLLQEKELNKGADLTESQKNTAINEYEKITATNEDFKAKYEKLQEDYAKLLAERKVKEQAATTKKNTKKSHEDFVKERKSYLDEFKEAKKKHEDYLKEQGIQKQGVGGLTLTPEMAKAIGKIVGSYIEEGVSKLDDIVSKITSDLSEHNIDEREIRNVIAGAYSEPKKTRNQVAEQKHNLKIQQQLLDKYESMLKGEKPKDEKRLIKFNQEIHDLREKIKGLDKEEKEANTFYGESDAGNKRIEKMEDELQRLKDRKPKANTPKEKREISDREKELKNDIAEERKKIRAEEKEANIRYKEEVDERVKKLQQLKSKNEKELEKIDEELKTGNFKKPEKKTPLRQDEELKKAFPQAYNEALKSQTLLIKARQARQLRMALQEFENLSSRDKALKNAVRYLNVPRTLMASMDFSAPLRQGILPTISHPLMARKAFKEMFGHAFNQAEFDRFYHDMQESPRYDVYKESGLAITDPHSLHLDKQEEAFLGGNLAEKIPVIGGGIKASERAYVSYLNKLRMDLFDRFADRFEAQGKTIDNSPELYKSLASFVNTSTGRGGMGKMERIAPELSTVLFAPRLIASRLNMLGIGDLVEWGTRALTLNKVKLGIGYYTKLPKELRVAAMGDMVKLVATGVTFLAAAKYGFGADVETDPRSSDFGKIKVGNTRWDIWGGLQPYVRLVAQLIAGATKSANSGKVYELGDDKPFGRTRTDLIGTSARGKLAPIPSMAWDLISGRDAIGEKIDKRFDIPFVEDENDAAAGEKTLTTFIGQHLIPLMIQDVRDALKEQGVKGLLTAGVPSVFGVGVNTYEPKPKKSKNHRPHRTHRTHVTQ